MRISIAASSRGAKPRRSVASNRVQLVVVSGVYPLGGVLPPVGIARCWRLAQALLAGEISDQAYIQAIRGPVIQRMRGNRPVEGLRYLSWCDRIA